MDTIDLGFVTGTACPDCDELGPHIVLPGGELECECGTSWTPR